MADNRSLSEVLADALKDISPEKAQAVAEHPDTPGVVQKIRDALGLGQPSDVMSPQERAAYAQSGAEDNSQPEQPSQNLISQDEIARNQAISDMAEAAARSSSSKPSKSHADEGAVSGILHVLLDSANNAIESVHTYAKDLAAVLKSSTTDGK